MKALILAAALSSLLTSCGELNPAMSPSTVMPDCAIQTFGSTVTIFDQIPGCAVVEDAE